MFYLIGLCVFGTVTLTAITLARGLSAPRMRLHERIEMIAADGAALTPRSRRQGLLRMQNYSSLPLVQRLLQGTARAERIADELDRAAIPLRVGEFLAVGVGIGLAFALVSYVLLPHGIVSTGGMIAGFLLGWCLPWWFVKRRLRRRRGQIERQLPDALDIISRSIRTGNGLLVSIDAVVEQMPGALGDEFGRMRQEVAAGLGFEDALRELDRRVASPDLHIVVTAFLIQREVGGNLTEILDNVSATVRGRSTLRRELRSLTSQQRYGAYIVVGMPPGILLLMAALNHSFVAPLFASTLGWTALGVAGVFELVGIVVMRWVMSSLEV